MQVKKMCIIYKTFTSLRKLSKLQTSDYSNVAGNSRLFFIIQCGGQLNIILDYPKWRATWYYSLLSNVVSSSTLFIIQCGGQLNIILPAVIHGFLFVHWATIWVKIEQLHCTLSLRGLWAIRNTPDFMLEHFIVLFLAGTRWTPSLEGWRLTVMTIGNGVYPVNNQGITLAL